MKPGFPSNTNRKSKEVISDMKRLFSMTLALMLTLSLMAGCTNDDKNTNGADGTNGTVTDTNGANGTNGTNNTGNAGTNDNATDGNTNAGNNGRQCCRRSGG